MNFKYIMIAVVSSFLMMIMLGISNSEIYALLSFCIILDSYLSNKNDKKKYRIIADDPIFWNLRYPYEDVKFLKKKKFLTFAFVGVIKNIIMISILLSQNSFNLLSYCSLCILSMIVCINDYLKIYNGGNLHKWVFIGINYILVFTYIVTLIIGNINRICINALLLIILAFAIFILIKNIKVKEEVYYQE